MIKTYKNFDLQIRGSAAAGYTVEAAVPDGGSVSPQPLELPRDKKFELQLDDVLHQTTSGENMLAVGEILFDALFPLQVFKLWSMAQGSLRDEEEGLRIRLHIGSPELTILPWELAFEEEYIGLRLRFPIVRYLDLPDPPKPVAVQPPLRVLVAVSQPKDTRVLNVDAELASIRKALALLPGRVEMDVLDHARCDELLAKLRQGFHVLHYIGHGKFEGGEGYLILEDSKELSDQVSASLLGRMVADSDLRLVVLNACETSISGVESTFDGVAQQLVSVGISAVVAMQLTIADQSAIAFSREFYGALADGWPVDAAVQEGRRGIMIALGNRWSECIDWAVPILYMRAPDGVIIGISEQREEERVLKAVPKGVVPLGFPLYVERMADTKLKQELQKPGTITVVRGARQTGKTSLLVRGVDHASQQGASVIYLDFQQAFDQSQMSDMNQFFRHLAYALAGQMQVSYSTVDSVWEPPLSAKDKMTRFVENAILQGGQEPVVLVMDEADVLLQTSFYGEFFGLLRAWHNRRALVRLWRDLSIVVAISTHPSLLIDDIHQSPFNVGLTIRLDDFSKEQVEDLNQRHGKPLQSEEITSAMDLLGGHPYLIRQALYTLVSEAMTWPELEAVADKIDGPFGEHLRFYWRLLVDDAELMEAARQVVIGGVCPEARALLRLSSACLVERQGGKCVCRYGLYKKFFRNQLL